MMKLRKYIVVKGIVQGVGFRPFVYKIAVDNNLNGWVNNTSKGVFIDIEGLKPNIDNFIYDLEHKSPPLSQINEILIEDREVLDYIDFEIKHSKEDSDAITFISPDFATCDDCIKDINDKKNRRYRYPFTNCTNCGPRFSIIKKLPYDRPVTTMGEFKMCDECATEYKDPLNRRFHAQPNACSKCGPQVELIDKHKNKINCEDAIEKAVSLIKEGNILAIKGLGGFHLACDATNIDTITNLRNRKVRPTKPLALMMKDIDTVKKYCHVSKKEEEILLNNKRPILLLNKKGEYFPNNIAPNNDKLGVMLAYTPLHNLLLEDLDVLVMTSANVSGIPMIYENDEAIEKLNNIVDYFLIHNRDIYIPVDDSVSTVVLGEERVIRNSRGYAPISMNLDNTNDTLACGSHLKNTFAISKQENVFISQYIGDMENLETYNNFENNVSHLKEIYNINPKVIAYDMHPNYWCNEFVSRIDAIKIPIQHHHAHIVSCMVENNVNDRVIGIAFDGTGYGTDGNIWGAEFMACDYKNFIREGHLNYVHIPGGDGAVKEPWKMAVSYMYNTYKDELYNYLPDSLTDKNIKPLISMIKNNINSPLCSSMGRLFDTVSALLGYKDKITFEGEAAILLESIADINEDKSYNYYIDHIQENYIIDTTKLIKGIINDLEYNVDKRKISMKFHNTIIDISVNMSNLLSKKYNIKKVALSGGVFHNEILLKGIYEKLTNQGFEVLTHKLIPTNDSGISLGQLVIANNNIKER
ncbi:carbamoyltransferase HypF [Romboutsia sp.]|uniref:carbamoyltransferase HypF n=1 Tax=Romboutsia sp. TaxID=1965302 RepID=UPI002F3EDCC8